jgi:hypothetical protein
MSLHATPWRNPDDTVAYRCHPVVTAAEPGPGSASVHVEWQQTPQFGGGLQPDLLT